MNLKLQILSCIYKKYNMKNIVKILLKVILKIVVVFQSCRSNLKDCRVCK